MLELAIKLAHRSTNKRHKTGAVIVNSKTGDIISTGWSHKGQTTWKTTPWSTHAEMHAILRAPHPKLLEHATIYIATVCSKSGNLTSAKPCSSCGALLSGAGIKQVIYTERIAL